MTKPTKDRKILIIGDSISIGYAKELKEMIHDNVDIINTECNARSSRYGVENIGRWVSISDNWNICIINHGIWDAYKEKGIGIDEYVNNLEFEIQALEKRCDKIVFVNTTVVNPYHSAYERYHDVSIYNDAARSIMENYNVSVCDAYTLSLTMIDEIVDDVHYTNYGYEQLARLIMDCISF